MFRRGGRAGRPKIRRSAITLPEPPPPLPLLPPIFDRPWRQMNWGENSSERQYVKDYKPQDTEVTRLRVMLYGPIGAGKSSFINSVSTALRGRACSMAAAGTMQSAESQSVTKQYNMFQIKRDGRSDHYKVAFNDVMGLEEGGGRGARVEDIKLAMKGHVPNKYSFNPVTPLSSSHPNYVHSPTADDKIHVLVCVCSANALEIKESVLNKMREIREAANDLGIPQILLLTKVDQACPETERDLKNIYRSKYVKKKMDQISSAVGIPLNCILPVKNYCKEISNDKDTDTLILSALRMIIDFGDDFIDTL